MLADAANQCVPAYRPRSVERRTLPGVKSAIKARGKRPVVLARFSAFRDAHYVIHGLDFVSDRFLIRDVLGESCPRPTQDAGRNPPTMQVKSSSTSGLRDCDA